MKSAFCIGYLLAIWVVDVSSVDYYFFNVHKTKIYRPHNFGYYKKSDSLLIMEITLKNIPASVTSVTVNQFTYHHEYYTMPDTFEVNVDINGGEGKFMILHSLKLDQIGLDVKLYNGRGLCNVTTIIEGRAMSSYYAGGGFYWNKTQKSGVYYYYRDWQHDASSPCLAPKACEIILDLKDTLTCKDQQESTRNNIDCHIKESQYNCTFVHATTNYEELELSQTYEDNTVIGPIMNIYPQTIKLSIELELFDNNTSVKLTPTRLRATKTLRSDTLNITEQDISKASNVTILNYMETTDVQFSCEQYKHRSTKIHVGFINTADNRITTHNTTIKKEKFKMADNGTMLCCLFYESETRNGCTAMRRSVEKKTLLIYQPQESTFTNLTESNEQRKATCHDKWWLYVLPTTLLVTAILLLTLYIVKKQRWCTNSQPAEETVELDDCATTNQVLYANLDFVHNESRAGNQTEESPYANIIGVLHPL